MSDIEVTTQPPGWILTTLGNVTQPSRPRHNPQDYFELPFIGMEQIEAHTMRLLGTVPARTMKSSAVHFQPGDVLYGRLRPYLNKVYRPDFEGLCSGEFIVFPNSQEYDTRYLQYYIASTPFVSFATHLNEGDRPRVDFAQLAEYPIFLPPLSEQYRIIAEIEQQFSRLDAGIAALKQAQTRLERYRVAIFQDACEGRLVLTEVEMARREGRSYEAADVLVQRILVERRTRWEAEQQTKIEAQGKIPSGEAWKAHYLPPEMPDTINLPELPGGWCWATIEQLASVEPNSITDGPFGSNLKTEHYTDMGPRVIRLANIGEGVFKDVRTHISIQRYTLLQKHRVETNDLVIAALGERLPRACMIPEYVGSAIVKADCVRFSPHKSLATKYINYALNMEATKTRSSAIVHGIGRPRLNLNEIKAIVLPLPPIAEQHRLVNEVELQLSVIEQLQNDVETNLRQAEKIRQSILEHAFAGQLVPQDPNDEPADILLERIRVERTKTLKDAEALRRATPRPAIKRDKAMRNRNNTTRPLLEVIKEANIPLTPDQLFEKAGFTRDVPEAIDSFYEQLRVAITQGNIVQERPNNADVLLRVVA